MKIILRIIVLPFVFSIILISYTYHAFRNSILFLIHGGEWNTYAKNDKGTIQEIFIELKNARNNHAQH